MKATVLATTALAAYFASRAATGDRSAPVAPRSPRPEDIGGIRGIRWKRPPLPAGCSATMLRGQTGLEWAPDLEEFGRYLAGARARA